MKAEVLCREDMVTITFHNIGKDINDTYVNAWIITTDKFYVDTDPMYAYRNFIRKHDPNVNIIEILDIYVPESCRCKGIGSKLMKELKKNFGNNTIFMVCAGYTEDDIVSENKILDIESFKHTVDSFYRKHKFKCFKPFDLDENGTGYIYIPNKKYTSVDLAPVTSTFSSVWKMTHKRNKKRPINK